MTGAEIDTFTVRLARFADRGLLLANAERVADKLVMRDRDADDRRLCVECASFQRGERCGNWRQAGIAIRTKDAQLSAALMIQLQRCDGFAPQL